MAWCYTTEVPLDHHVMLGSTDISLIKWFQDEITKIAPKAVMKHEYHDLNNNIVRCHFEKLNNLDSKIRHWLIQNLLQTGWEPFTITTVSGTISFPQIIYFRREVAE